MRECVVDYGYISKRSLNFERPYLKPTATSLLTFYDYRDSPRSSWPERSRFELSSTVTATEVSFRSAFAGSAMSHATGRPCPDIINDICIIVNQIQSLLDAAACEKDLAPSQGRFWYTDQNIITSSKIWNASVLLMMFFQGPLFCRGR